MSTKSRGSNAERDLVDRFWEAGWACMRSPGSGSTSHPSPDILAGKGPRKLAIECKLTTDTKKYFTSEEISELKIFSEKFGAEAWVAIKFFRKPWIFVSVEDLDITQKHYVATPRICDSKGLTFEELTT